MWGTRMAHCRSLGFARDDKKERLVEWERTGVEIGAGSGDDKGKGGCLPGVITGDLISLY
jgi:hypothetical protein